MDDADENQALGNQEHD
jgi:hypothetical protein